jgi:Insertion element 4 transposase N-terminal/Transposase DDE domain
MLVPHKDVAALSRAQVLAGLKRIVPPQRIKSVLQRTHREQRFCPRLPTVCLVWFTLGLGLFCRDCYRQVFRALLPRRRGTSIPGRSTLCEARHRLGVAPLVQLAQETVKLLAEPQTPGAFYRDLRLMALDGFVVDLPDTPENERVFGRPPGSRAPGAFPQARIVALCEAGTHVIYRWLIKPIGVAEQPMASYLLRFLEPGMLLLWDRNFLSYARLQGVLHAQAHLLARVQKHQVFQPLQRLGDGSFLARLYRNRTDRRQDRDGIPVRIIEYTFDDPHRPGHAQKHRLLTTLRDEKLDPAVTLIVLYHARWEQELAIDELKSHEMERPTLRSQTPAGVVQELYALLIDHFVVRALMFEAARLHQLDPRRLSFTATLKILRCRIPACPRTRLGQRRWWRDLLEEISQEVLPSRRNRINPRVIKRKMSKWKKKRPEHLHYPQPTKTFQEAVVMIH